MDLRTTQAPLKLRFEVDAPEAAADELASLVERTERYCEVLQTLTDSPRIETRLASPGA